MKDNLIGKLVQARKGEASKKNVNSKLILIAKTYGSPIVGHYYDSPLTNEDWDSYMNADNDWSKMPEMEETVIPRLGYVFDSLRSGVNLEIVVKAREHINSGKREMDKPTEVRCSYNGYKVYHEDDGVLRCYAPFPEWEKPVDRLYEQAVGSDKRIKMAEVEQEKKVRKEAAKKTLHTLRMLWGI